MNPQNTTKKKKSKKKTKTTSHQHTPDPWEKQNDETIKAYMAFCVYRDLGASRSLKKTTEKFYPKSTSNLHQIATWSSKFHWVSRIEAWEIELDRAKQEAQKEALEKMAKRHAEAALKLQEKGLEGLKKIDPESLSPKDTLNFITEAAKLERLTLGAPDHKIEHSGQIETRDSGLDRLIAEDPETKKIINELLTTLSAHESRRVRIPGKSPEMDSS